MTPNQDLLADLTPAQAAAVMHGEGPLLILAGAGSGKTRVITRRVAYLLQSGVRASNILAITFTNKAAGEMRHRVEQLVPGNRVFVSTFHSLGARVLRQYADRLNIDKNFTIYDTDDRNKLVKEALERAGIDNTKFTPERLGGAISKAKNALLTPARFAETATDFFAQSVARIYTAYEKQLRAANAMDFDDLLYLPAMALKMNEELRAESDNRFRYVLIDEYQDTNMAQYEIAKRLSIHNPNICVVGDPDQCLLPSTVVTTDSGLKRIDKVKEGDLILSAIGWGKVAPKRVEKVMCNPYEGTIIRIKLTDGQTIRATPNHICFARLQADSQRHHVYLMYKKGVGYRLGTTRGVRASKDGVIMSGLQVRTNQEVADAIWVARTCDTAAEARYYEALYSVLYGIPTAIFFVRGRSTIMTQELIDRLFASVDTLGGAKRLMADLLLDRRFPHHRPGAVVRGELARRFVLFTMFGDVRPKTEGRWHEHRVQLVTSGEPLRQRAAAVDLPVRNGNKGTWRIETSRQGYDDAMTLAGRICELDAEFELVSRARLTPQKPFLAMPASHLRPGMIVPVHEGSVIVEKEVIAIDWEAYTGPVYDLSIPHTRNFIANGLVVHNSIYKWRGSDIRNILDFERDYPTAKVITLEQNYRSTQAILAAAGAVIDHNKQRKKKRLITENPTGDPVRVLTFDNGLDEAEGIVLQLKAAVAEKKYKYRDVGIFLRINALTRSLESAFVKHGVPFQIVRGLAFYERKETRDVLAYLRLLTNPNDAVSFRRIVNEPVRGIGKVSLERLEQFAIDHEITLTAACGQVQKITEIRGKAQTGLRDFFRLMTDLRAHLDHPPQDLIRMVLDKSGYRRMLEQSKDEEDADRLANIDELITAAKQYHDEDGTRSLVDFLENIALASDVDSWDEESDLVSVMTLHAAKGLEFPVVFIMAVEQGLLPHERSMNKDEDVEEERRLFFVGITRAMRELNICHARLREFRGQTLYAVPSMFLDELPKDVVHLDASAAKYGVRGGNDYRAATRNGPLPPVKPAAFPAPSGSAGTGVEYAVGQVVQHDEYGIGQISEVSGFGALRRLKIRFAAAGEKTFVADKVKLRVVQRK